MVVTSIKRKLLLSRSITKDLKVDNGSLIILILELQMLLVKDATKASSQLTMASGIIMTMNVTIAQTSQTAAARLLKKLSSSKSTTELISA